MEKEKLINTIANDLKIPVFENEDTFSFQCRVIYSALGEWLRHLVATSNNTITNGMSIKKAELHRCLQEILDSFINLNPDLADYYVEDGKIDAINSIRESILRSREINEIGFESQLVTGHSLLFDVSLKNTSFYSGLAKINFFDFDVSELLKMFNIPLQKSTDLLDYYISNAKWEENHDLNSYEHFNPNLNKVLSQCWRTRSALKDGEIGMVRQSMSIGTYNYQLALKLQNKIYVSKFSEYASNAEIRDTQRLLYALKARQKNPSVVSLRKYKKYTLWTFWSTLPPAEMYLLRFIGWPIYNISNMKQAYLVRNELSSIIEKIIFYLEVTKEEH